MSNFSNKWSKYIQINIYGKRLEKLQNEGVDLKNYLNKIGCENVWVSEVAMYHSDSDSGCETTFDETSPVLSQTVYSHKIPRCSTPLHSQKEPNFTLCVSKPISRIESNSSDFTTSFNNSENTDFEIETEIEEILDNLIEKVHKSEKRSDFHEASKLNYLRASQKLTISSSYIHPKPKKPTKLRTIPSSPIINNLPVCKTSKKVMLKRSKSFVSKKSPKNQELSQNLTILPIFNVKEEQLQTESNPIMKQISVPSQIHEKVYTELKNVNQNYFDNLEIDEVPQFPISSLPNAENSSFYSAVDDSSVKSHVEIGSDISFFNDEEAMNDWHDDTELMEFCNTSDKEVECDINQVPTTSSHVIKKSSRIKKKQVSFALPDQSKKRKEKDAYKKSMNEIHIVKCQYEDCQNTYNWKKKYGKLRLIDHALTHANAKLLCCQLCNHRSWNTRQIRNHYSSQHPSSERKGYRMKDLPIGSNDIKFIWNLCYKDYLHFLGEPVVRCKKTKILKSNTFNIEEISSENRLNEQQRDDNFYFLRIC